MSASIERRVTNLEAEEGLGKRHVLRIIFDPCMIPEGDEFRELRILMLDDGSRKGRYVRTLEKGELVEDADGGLEPWLRVEDEIRKKADVDLAKSFERYGENLMRAYVREQLEDEKPADEEADDEPGSPS